MRHDVLFVSPGPAPQDQAAPHGEKETQEGHRQRRRRGGAVPRELAGAPSSGPRPRAARGGVDRGDRGDRGDGATSDGHDSDGDDNNNSYAADGDDGMSDDDSDGDDNNKKSCFTDDDDGMSDDGETSDIGGDAPRQRVSRPGRSEMEHHRNAVKTYGLPFIPDLTTLRVALPAWLRDARLTPRARVVDYLASTESMQMGDYMRSLGFHVVYDCSRQQTGASCGYVAARAALDVRDEGLDADVTRAAELDWVISGNRALAAKYTDTAEDEHNPAVILYNTRKARKFSGLGDRSDLLNVPEV